MTYRRRPAAILAAAALLTMLAGGVSAQGAPDPVPATPVQASPPQTPAPPPTLPEPAVPGRQDPAAPNRPLPAAPPAGHDMSPWSMFLGADVIVKGVMIGLAFASLVTWTVLIAKSFELALSRRRIDRALRQLRMCNSLADAESLFPRSGREVVSSLVGEASDEARLSAGIGPGGGVRDRATARCTEAIRAEGRKLRIGTGLLATIGSTAPFVGLFGTVWGIMNSFVGISKAQTTNLAVVAPGIAEALLATAIGLVAAIPAVIIYNHFARVTKNHLELVNRASGVVLRLLSRDLDRARVVDYRMAAE